MRQNSGTSILCKHFIILLFQVRQRHAVGKSIKDMKTALPDELKHKYEDD